MRRWPSALRPPTSLARFARRLAPAGALAAALVLTSRCTLVESPWSPGPAMQFTAPLADTVVNLGDRTAVLPCDLRIDGRPIPCVLGLAIDSGAVVSAEPGPRLLATRGCGSRCGNVPDLALGTATVAMRPLHVQLPADTIVRFARVRTVVPRLAIANCASGEDVLTAVGDERVYLPIATSRDGRVVPFISVIWVQESGAEAATLLPGRDGRVRALAAGVATFRVAVDTATARCRVRVVEAP